MTSVNNGFSEKAGNKKKSQNGVRTRKSVTKPSVSNDIDNELTCFKCATVFVDADDKLLECERCENWNCIKCAELDDSVYTVMIANKNLHWFCLDCEKPALTAVKCDKEIEEKCAAYMSTITGKIGEIEGRLDKKADKSDIEGLEERIKDLEQKGTDHKPHETCTDTVSETIAEQRERENRVRNLIIQNLAESEKSELEDKKADDFESVEALLKETGIEDENIVEKCVRIGKKESVKTRIMKVTVTSVDVKKKILKNCKVLKDSINYGNIYIAPDLTKMQREQEYRLRSELRDRKDKGETNIFISGGRIVQARERSLRFKGGASATTGET